MEPKIQEKVWDPKIELEIRKKWEESGIYDFTMKDSNYTKLDTCQKQNLKKPLKK